MEIKKEYIIILRRDSGQVRKNYVSKQCHKHGTVNFWKMIEHMRYASNKKRAKKMGTTDLYEDTEEGQALIKGLEIDEMVNIERDLLKHAQ